MPNIGVTELLILLGILLLIFGPKRLPGLGRSLGQGMREFKDSVTGKKKKEDDPEHSKPELDPPVGESEGTTESPVDAEVVSDDS